MRNLLEHYKGKLFATAMEKREQKTDWPTMAERLTISIKDSFEHQLLLDQEQVWKSLHQNLSGMAKHNPKNEYSIEIARTKLLSHLYVVLSLVRL